MDPDSVRVVRLLLFRGEHGGLQPRNHILQRFCVDSLFDDIGVLFFLVHVLVAGIADAFRLFGHLDLLGEVDLSH